MTNLPAWKDLPYPQRVFFLLGLALGRGSEVEFSEAMKLYEKVRSDAGREAIS